MGPEGYGTKGITDLRDMGIRGYGLLKGNRNKGTWD